MTMGMAVQNEVDRSVIRRRGDLGIMDDENASTGPFDRARWVDEIHPVSRCLGGQLFSFGQIVISEHAQDRYFKVCEEL